MTHSLEPSTFGATESSPKAIWRWRYEDASGAEVSTTEDGLTRLADALDILEDEVRRS